MPRPGLLPAPELGDELGERHASPTQVRSGTDDSVEGRGVALGADQSVRSRMEVLPGFWSRRFFDTQPVKKSGTSRSSGVAHSRATRSPATWTPRMTFKSTRPSSKPRQPESERSLISLLDKPLYRRRYMVAEAEELWQFAPAEALVFHTITLDTRPLIPGPSFALNGPGFLGQESCVGDW